MLFKNLFFQSCVFRDGSHLFDLHLSFLFFLFLLCLSFLFFFTFFYLFLCVSILYRPILLLIHNISLQFNLYILIYILLHVLFLILFLYFLILYGYILFRNLYFILISDRRVQ